MSSIHNISHPNKLIQSKVNYFANYYSFVVGQLGKNSDFEIDNILSIIEKILFQLENNDEEKTYSFVTSYLTNPLVNTENKYFKEYTHHKKVSLLFDEYREADGKNAKKNWLKTNKSKLIFALKKFQTYLKKNMFEKALKSIISFLQCSHNIEEHKDDLKHYTYLIAVELFYEYNGLANIEDIFRKIMSRDINEFPFPPSFIKKNKANLLKAKKGFLKTRTFEQQFEGIKNFLNQKNDVSNFVFRIGNIRCDKDFKLNLNDTMFCGISNPILSKIKESFERKKTNYDVNYFSENTELYVIVKHKSKSLKNPHYGAIDKAMIGLENLNKVCKTSAFIDRDSYLFTSDLINIGYSLSLSNKPKYIKQSSALQLISENVYDYLENKKAKSKHKFLSHEPTFINAKNKESIDEYWKYIENLIGKRCQNKFSNLVSSLSKEIETQNIKYQLEDFFSLWGYSKESFGFTFEEQRLIAKEIEEADNFDFSSLIPRINNSFVIDTFDYYKNMHRKENSPYILRIINEAFEQRNFIQHAGKMQTKSILKLKETLPILIDMFRRRIIEQMVNNPTLKFEEIVAEMN